MVNLDAKYNFMASRYKYVSRKHQDDKIISFEKGDLVFVFNFNATKSFEHYRVGTDKPYEHKIVLDSDDAAFGGHNRVKPAHNNRFPIIKEGWDNRQNYIQVYIPARTVLVFSPIRE